MSDTRLHFEPADFTQALNLGQGAGFECHSVAELFAFVTGLLAWPDLAKALGLPPEKDWSRVMEGPGAWWFRGVKSDRYPLHSSVFRYQGKEGELAFSRAILDPDDLD